MKELEESIKTALSPEAQEKFDDVATQRVLGATAHIRLISEMLYDIAKNARKQGKTVQEITEQAENLADYFIRTRGQASQAVSNAIRLMMADVSQHNAKSVEEAAAAIKYGIRSYMEKSNENLKKIHQFVWNVIKHMNTVMLFDYSSTVNSIADITFEHGHKLNCYIPQSIALDGGRPYVKTFKEKGHSVHVIPDAAMYYYVRECDGVFIGAETYYHDGRAFNTVGSELLAFLCKSVGVPFYVVTPLIKLDIRALHGYEKPPVIIQIPERTGFTFSEKEKENVDFSTPELVEIPAEYIHAFVTEEGIIPPWGMYSISRRYFEKLGGISV